MSPARRHRERLAAQTLNAVEIPALIASVDGGGQDTPPATTALTPARQHRLTHAIAAADPGAELASEGLGGITAEAAQVQLRLTHDLRRLKEIASIEGKKAAKREMLPEYRPWVEGLLAAAQETGKGVADEVLPTIMVWLIDTGIYSTALELADYVLRYNVPLPSRYKRQAPALVAELIADAAIADLADKRAFSLEVLQRVADLTAASDMHDEIRAKLFKATGMELQRQFDADAEALPLAEQALYAFRRAKQLNDRVGVTDRIKRLEKVLGKDKAPPAAETNLNDTIDRIAAQAADGAMRTRAVLEAVAAGNIRAVPDQVQLSWSEEDKVWVASIAALRCASHGPTRAEAIIMLADALAGWIETVRAKADPAMAEALATAETIAAALGHFVPNEDTAGTPG